MHVCMYVCMYVCMSASSLLLTLNYLNRYMHDDHQTTSNASSREHGEVNKTTCPSKDGPHAAQSMSLCGVRGDGLERAVAWALRNGSRELILPLRMWVLGVEGSAETHQVVQGGPEELTAKEPLREQRRRKPLPPRQVELFMKAFKAALAKAQQQQGDGGWCGGSVQPMPLIVTVLCTSTAACARDMDAFPDQVRRADARIASKVCALAAKIFT
jgi:hypothetical protein